MGLDPFDLFCNLVLGRAKWGREEVDEVLSWVDRSIDLIPNYANAHFNSGKLNAITCAGETADRDVDAAMQPSPLDPHRQSMLSARAFTAFVQNNPDRATAFADQSLKALNVQLYVCVIAAAIDTRNGRYRSAHQACR